MSSVYFSKLDEEAKKRYVEKLKWEGGVLPDPYDQEKFKEFVDDVQQWPRIQMHHVIVYLVETPGPYTLQSIKGFKSLQAYTLYESGHIREIKVYPEASNKIRLVSGRVLPSQKRVKDSQAYHCWIIAEMEGIVRSAHCNCKAGLGEACSHIGALLIAIEHAVASGKTEIACTSMPCAWKKIEKQVANIPVEEMDFNKQPLYNKHMKQSTKRQKCNPVSVPKCTDHSGPSLIHTLRTANPTARIFFNETSGNSSEETDTATEGEETGLMEEVLPSLPPPLTDLYTSRNRELSNSELQIYMTSVLDMLYLDPSTVNHLEICTRYQSYSKIWHNQRAGRITASNFHKILSQKKTSSPINLLCSIMGYTDRTIENIPAVCWGRTKESQARQAFILHEGQRHINLTCHQTGLHVLENYPYLGASPDGIVECNCCGRSLLELKCPFKYSRKSISDACDDKQFFLSKDKTLKPSHAYYTQVQGQMGVTGIKKCFFVVWTEVEVFCVLVRFDAKFWDQLLEKLKTFFITFVLKELCVRKYDPLANSHNGEILYCECQSPEFTQMIACDGEKCHIIWYHRKCVGLKRSPGIKWFCQACKYKNALV